MSSAAMDMTTGSLWRKAFAYTVPIILTGFLQLVFNAADLIVAGRFCGSISVAAVGGTGALTQLVVNFFVGFSIGAGVGVAQGIGAHNDEQVRQFVHTAIPTAIVSGLILTVLGITFSKPMLTLMATPDEVINLSATYMRLYFSGMVFMMVYNFGASILRAVGDTTRPLIIVGIASVLNIIMNLVSVRCLKMGVAGVALSTALAQVFSAVFITIELTKRTDACKLVLSKMRIYGNALRKIIFIGLPAGIQGSLFSVSNVVIQSSINSLGAIAMTGNTAAASIEGFEYIGMNAFQQTAMNFIGQNAGARRFDRVQKILGVTLLYVSVFGIVVSTIFFTFRNPLLGIYITDSAEAIRCGIIRMSFICVPYFLCGIMDVMTGSLRGLGYSTSPMAISIFGIVIFRVVWILTVFQIPQFHTLESIYISYPISWVITIAVELIVFFILLRRLKIHAGIFPK